MRGRLAAVVLSILLCGFWALAAYGAAQAAGVVDTIEVNGNRHVDAATVRSYFRPAADGQLNGAALDAALKALYQTGLFSDVKIGHDGGRIVVKVVENPLIRRVAVEGNKKVKDADLTKALQSKPGGPLSRFIVQGDVQRLDEIYRAHGYFQARIEPQTIDAKNGRDDLVFQIKEGDKLAVRKILFTGNNAFAANKLTGQIKTGKTNFMSFLLDNDIYDADKIANDCDLVRRFYRDHGYADARVRSVASYEPSEQGVVLTFAIDEGPFYRFGKVDLQSHMKAVDGAAFRSYVLTPTGDAFNADAIDKSVDALTMALARSGQPFATVAARVDREPPAGGAGKPGIVDLVYTIDEGNRVYVERIVVHGNTKTHDDVIRRQLDFDEGDAYNRALVDRAERRLKALGYFKSVKTAIEPGSAPDRIVLDIDVVEQDTGNFNISGGYSTVTGAMVSVGVSDTNMFGAGYVGKVQVTYGQYARSFDIALSDPYFLDQRLSAGIELFGNQTLANVNQSFDSTTYGGKLSFGTPLTDQLGVTWSYSLYNQSVSLDPVDGVSSLPIQQAAAEGPIWVSSIGVGMTYSTLDNPKNPTNGLRIQTNNEIAGLGGGADFAKTTEDIRYYHQVAGDVVGMVRTQDGYITPYGGQQLPFLDGFFGGPQLIRGFAPNGFGPRDVTPGTTMDNLGGNVYWTMSAELEAPVPGVPADANLKMALFSDVGSLWATGSSASSLAALSQSQSQQITNSKGLRASAGVGLVWDSPFGAMEVDYAYPFMTQPGDVTQRLNFTAGQF
jgi:outer membrane protein insertion porin family